MVTSSCSRNFPTSSVNDFLPLAFNAINWLLKPSHENRHLGYSSVSILDALSCDQQTTGVHCYYTAAARSLGRAASVRHSSVRASPTTRKNARSAHAGDAVRDGPHRFQRSQTILRHVGGRRSTRNSRRRRRLFHNNVANSRHRSAAVHRRLIFIDCCADDRASQPVAAGQPTAPRSRSRDCPRCRDVIACMLMSRAHSIIWRLLLLVAQLRGNWRSSIADHLPRCH